MLEDEIWNKSYQNKEIYMNVIEMYKKGLEMGLGKWDVFPISNPQRLTMNDLEKRTNDYYLTCDYDKNFRGGAWSGD